MSASTGKTKLPFLTKQQFAEEVQLLLAEYASQHAPILEPPVPVDDIVELYLKLDLELMDMEAQFKVTDVLGALWVNERKIGISHLLDPHENPSALGRYRFTLAHEVGHWRLHRRIFQKRKANQLKLLTDGTDRPEYICRSSDKAPIEFQADAFAAALLMPAPFVHPVWHEVNGGSQPQSLAEIRDSLSAADRNWVSRRASYKQGSDSEDQALFEFAAQPMAERFETSLSAMKNRLVELELLVKDRQKTLFE